MNHLKPPSVQVCFQNVIDYGTDFAVFEVSLIANTQSFIAGMGSSNIADPMRGACDVLLDENKHVLFVFTYSINLGKCAYPLPGGPQEYRERRKIDDILGRKLRKSSKTRRNP